MASTGLAFAVTMLFATAGVVAGIREELFAASSLATCEARVEQLQLQLSEATQEVKSLRSQLARSQQRPTKTALHDTGLRSFTVTQARSLAEMAAEEGELIVPSADVMKVLGDVSSQLAVKKHEAQVLEEAARIAMMMAAQAAEEQESASEQKDEKEESFQKALEEYEKAEEAAEKEMESAQQQMEDAKKHSLKTVAAADTRLQDAVSAGVMATGTLKLSTSNLEARKPELEATIKKAAEELKNLVTQQAADEAKRAEANNIRDAVAEDMHKTKADHDSKTQEALDEFTQLESQWMNKIEVLSDKVDEAERKLSEAALGETATRSVSSKLEVMKTEKAKAHKEAQKALQMYTMGEDEMQTYQANVDKVYGWVTNCERKWFKGGLRATLMNEGTITAEEVAKASKLQKPRNEKAQEDVFSVMKAYFAHMSALKMDTSIFGKNFADYGTPMSTTFAAVETETMKLANMACKYWAVTKGGESTASDESACSLFIKKECSGRC
mmetsp:Transcript_17398/g.39204  ORF Transcript_17398/g.39204 Transcript_17398/m.39204 type:complete len:499 (-) Transcript_17398:102-1598(-)